MCVAVSGSRQFSSGGSSAEQESKLWSEPGEQGRSTPTPISQVTFVYEPAYDAGDWPGAVSSRFSASRLPRVSCRTTSRRLDRLRVFLNMRCTVVAAAVLALAMGAAGQLPDNAADLPISQLLNLASSALSAGKSSSALSIYDYCLERDPQDAATLYKRATVRLATGQLAKAKEGFHEVLQVKDFEQAHYQLAKLHAKLGEFDAAKTEVDAFIATAGSQPSKELNDAKELVSLEDA